MAGIFLPGTSKGGDISGVTAGVGLSGGGDSGGVTLTLDLSELSPVTPASGDSLATLDSDDANEQLTTTDALATLFAGAGMTATSAAVNVIGGNGITANANDVAITAAQTTITSIYNSALILGGDDETAIDFGTSNEIDFKADDAVRLTLTASSLYPVTNNQIDLGTASLEFKDAFFDGTVTADAFAGPLTGTASNATTVTNNAITLAKMAGLARGTIIYGDASGDPAALGVGDADEVLTHDGTDIAWAAVSGSATALDDIATGDGAASLVTTVGNITIDAQANDADVIIKVDDAGAAITAVTFDGSDEGNAIFANDVQLKTDGALLEFGADLDTTLTHTDGTGLTLNSTNKLTFGDVATFIQQSSDGVMTIDGEATIDLNASTAVLVSNDLKLDSDAAILSLGAGADFTITHDGDVGATIAGSPITITAAEASTWSTSSGALTITSAAAATWSTAAGVLTIDGDDGIVLNTGGSGNVQVNENLVVGVDDAGFDVTFFGAAAGAYMLWDEDVNLLDIRGATAAGPGHLKLTTGELTVVDADVLGRIDFQAPLEGDSGDSRLVGASIWAEADATFSSTVNNTDIVFATGKTATAAEIFRFTADNEIGIAGANYGTDGQVLTSGGADAAVAWEDAGGGGGLVEYDVWALSSSASDPADGVLDTNLIRWNPQNGSESNFELIGDGMTKSSGQFTFPSIGKYEVIMQTCSSAAGSSTTQWFQLQHTVNGAGNPILTIASLATYITSSSGSVMLDIKDTADTVAFNILQHTGTLYGDATHFYTGLAFKKVGDTD